MHSFTDISETLRYLLMGTSGNTEEIEVSVHFTTDILEGDIKKMAIT